MGSSKKPGLSDADILRLIGTGELYVKEGQVYKYHKGRKTWYRLSAQRHPLSGRIRYFIRSEGRGRTIYRNRLVWLYEHRKPVPEGYDIHHVDHDNENDHPENLDLDEARSNRQQNYSRKNIENCLEYFDRKLAEQHGSEGDF